MRFQAIVFDRDGTLFDSLPVILKAFDYAIEPFATRKPAQKEWFAAFGPAEPEVLAKFIGEKHKDEAFLRFFHYYQEHFHEIHPFPGIMRLLERLKKAGVKLSLFTGGGRKSTEFCLQKLGVLSYFEDLVCGDEVLRPKPDPEGILKTMAALGATPSRTLVVGDAGADILAGKAAGAFTALARWSGAPPAFDLPADADVSFCSVIELEKFVFEP